MTVLCAAAGIAACVGTLAFAQPARDGKPAAPAAAQPEMKLPPGWTTEDMQACVEAGMPGKMHERLAKAVGVWEGKGTMWMGPGGEPMKCAMNSKTTTIMDGRYTRCEITGDMPGMGPFTGLGVNGYDNVSQKFVSNWIDNHSTGIMAGTGEISADGKTLTWTYTYNCPVTRKPASMRQIERFTGDNTMTLEAFGPDPKTGKEYKLMSFEFTRKP
jgi:hypothetical protein